MNAKLVAITTFALVSAAAAHAEPVRPEPGRQVFTLEYRYDAAKSPEANYDAFRHMAQRRCDSPGLRPIQTLMRERACVTGIMDRFVETLGRAEIAAVHAARTGRAPAAAPVRDFAARG
jgi:hypothetical protein